LLMSEKGKAIKYIPSKGTMRKKKDSIIEAKL